MDWSTIDTSDERRGLAQALVAIAPRSGVGQRALSLASTDALGDSNGWKSVFPGGSTEALWFISEVSDASMSAAFTGTPAPAMADVIQTRFDQNVALKSFVWRVMQYDIMHPLQALARMQRTARVMFACVRHPAPPRFTRLTFLNLAYTALVFGWLLDRSEGDRASKRATRMAMRWLGI